MQLIIFFQEKNKKQGCVFWKGYLNQYFTRADLCLLKDILVYSLETKKQLKNERSLMKRKVSKPAGMPDLTGTFERVIEEAWEHRIVEPNLNMDKELEDQVGEEELLQNALAAESNQMFEEKRLNTESVQALMDLKGYMTCETAEYFCKLLDEQYPESKFIHLNQYLSRKENRELHALEINVKKYKNLHFIFNRNSKKIFDTKQLDGHHWAVATIREDKSVYFGDGLYKNIPANLKVALNDYFQVRFRKPLEKIINLSGRKHFPKQTDGYLCGFIGLMNMTLLENEHLLDFFNLNCPRLKNNDFLIFRPSAFNLYLRQIFMKAYATSSLRVGMFISDIGFASIKQVLDEVKEPLNPQGFQEKFSQARPRKQGSSSRLSRSQTKQKDVSSENSRTVPEEEIGHKEETSNDPKDVIEEDIVSNGENGDKGNENEENKSKSGAKIVLSDFTGKVIL